MVLAGLCGDSPIGDQPRADATETTGHLAQLSFDTNKNGKNDTVAYMDGTRIVRIELDLDENGEVERWDFYFPDGTLNKVGLASRDDGVMDSQAFYSPAGDLQRIEISTKRDDHFDRTEFYEKNVLVRSQDDTNGDGKPDKWDEYAPMPNHAVGEPPYTITSSAFDDTGSGHPQRRFVYGPKGAIARVEIDPGGTGNWRLRPPTLIPDSRALSPSAKVLSR